MSEANSFQRAEDLTTADIEPRLIAGLYRQFGSAKPLIQKALVAQVDKALDELEKARGTGDFEFRASEAVKAANTSRFFRRFGEFAVQRAKTAAEISALMPYSEPCKAVAVYRK
jgi:hypothetical protein